LPSVFKKVLACIQSKSLRKVVKYMLLPF
jgi:hypothetical protein